MKLAIVGSREFSDYELLKRELLSIKNITTIISGGARGADSLAKRYADEFNIRTEIYYPNWEKFGRKAGFVRNGEIVTNCDELIAFWDEESKGTKHSINLAKSQNKLLKVVLYNEI